MNFEKYTERARGFIQSAQMLAMREGHPQLAPGHLLKVLLDDPEGLCAGLIDRAGGQLARALAAIEAWLAKQPKVSGDASQPQATRELVRAVRHGREGRREGRRSLRHRRAAAARARDREGHGGGPDPGRGRRHARRR